MCFFHEVKWSDVFFTKWSDCIFELAVTCPPLRPMWCIFININLSLKTTPFHEKEKKWNVHNRFFTVNVTSLGSSCFDLFLQRWLFQFLLVYDNWPYGRWCLTSKVQKKDVFEVHVKEITYVIDECGEIECVTACDECTRVRQETNGEEAASTHDS